MSGTTSSASPVTPFLHTPQMGLVSVVVPVFNGSRWLGEAIDSVLDQTYRPLEIIAVDNGSTDASRDVLARYPQVLVVEESRAGVTFARNSGLRHAHGELIAFIDQDDRWRASKLEIQVRLLRERPDVGCALGHQLLFLEPGYVWPDWIASRVPSLSRAHVGYLPGAMLVRRSTLDAVGVFNEHFVIGSDADWLVHARDLGVVLQPVEEIVIDKRMHGDNLSHDPRTATDMLKVLADSLRRRREIADHPAKDATGDEA